MADLFRFKKFTVDQTGCAMKVNTDGVLIGALAHAENPMAILDIGTGTGVISLMMAQRYPGARVDAVEIDPQAAETASRNFGAAPFSDRLRLYADSFERFLESNPELRFDLIVTNPPFFLNSLRPEDKARDTARHTHAGFFDDLFRLSRKHLSPGGTLAVILPLETVDAVEHLAFRAGLNTAWEIAIKSFPTSVPHREIVGFRLEQTECLKEDLVIYESGKVYSDQYRELLKDFLIIF
jgi:tRNA1Val (adenine37-N6)-methyltransferase